VIKRVVVRGGREQQTTCFKKKKEYIRRKRKDSFTMKTQTKNKVGRPSKFDQLNIEMLRKLYVRGFTDLEVCKLLKIDESTLTKWKQNKPDFFTSLKEWKQEADQTVEIALFERAQGYSHPEDKIFQYEGKAIIVPTTKIYPPDPTSMIFWLKNRQPDKWRDKQEIEHSGDVIFNIKGIEKV
jgi:hypothetical protein